MIFIFRDPAAWLWAAFNFWFIDGFDAPPSPRPDWAGSNQYRTSELFHEGIVSGSRTGLGQFLNDFRHMSVMNPRQWIAMLGRDNLLFIKNEDMSPADPSRLGSLTDQISTFIGLTKDGFSKSILGARTNCGDMKGDRQECHAASGTYQISGKREMLPHTKDIIYLQFLEECNIWSKEFDVHYPACLNILHVVGLHGKYNVRVGAVVWLWQIGHGKEGIYLRKALCCFWVEGFGKCFCTSQVFRFGFLTITVFVPSLHHQQWQVAIRQSSGGRDRSKPHEETSIPTRRAMVRGLTWRFIIPVSKWLVTPYL